MKRNKSSSIFKRFLFLLGHLTLSNLIEASGGPHCGESGVGEGLLASLGRRNAVDKGELDVLLRKLHAVLALEILRGDDFSANDLDGTRAGTVAASHLVVELRDGASEGQVAELTVHVVGAGPGVVAEPDTVVLDDTRVLLNNLDAVKDLASRLLHLTELVKVVPELGFRDDGVRGENDHTVGLRVGLVIRWHFAADDLVLAQLSSDSHLALFTMR